MKGFCMLLACWLSTTLASSELTIVCSTTDLADLAKQVGGDKVEVSFLVRASENPHFISARPSYIRRVASADAFVVVGLDLEVGWAPALIRSARNRSVAPGQPGYIDCSQAIQPLEILSENVDRSMGDVHPHGNPHYLLSPVCGMQVLDFLAQRFGKINPENKAFYQEQAQVAIANLAIKLYGEQLVTAHATTDLLQWHQAGTLWGQVGEDAIGGWLQQLRGINGAQLIDDHSQWPYLAACFRFTIAAHLEPKAGIPPSSSHTQSIIAQAQGQEIAGIISSPWFDPSHAKKLSEATKLPSLVLAHQTGAVPNTETYTKMIDFNVTQLASLVTPAEETTRSESTATSE